MKTLRYILFALSLPLAVSVSAQELAGSQVRIDNKAVSLGSDTQLLVGMDITVPADMKLSTNSMLTLTPILMEKDGEGANKALPSIYVYGRTRQLVAERTGKIPADAFEVLRRDNGDDQVIRYTARVPYEKWMNGSDLKIMGMINGCANCLKEENIGYVSPILLKRYAPQPVPTFVKPAAEIKERNEKGNAYLDFPVNQTVIYPNYRRNPFELAEINRTINVVKDNPDTEITGIELHGYASPEGSYANNTRLAEGRSQALKNYIMKEYGLGEGMFKVQSTPEDWAGYRKYIESSDFAKKNEVLAIMDSDEKNLDTKEYRIKALDGQMYRTILNDCYPALRHTDYVIHYTVRPYSVEEAKKLLKTRPQLLSLEEMYLVAQTYEEGSEDFNEVFDIAVRMYPNDPTANINAAAMELKRGNVDQAVRYLERSDKSTAAAQNNQGVYHLLKGELDKAEECFKQAKNLGSPVAEANLEEVNKKRVDNKAFGE
ncbi:MAG: DUF3868 domain-containing protein [Bacteroidaceae bacterium]|nr:DUF3868 domain-containing protein [Bacteroidaceae bacterium]